MIRGQHQPGGEILLREVAAWLAARGLPQDRAETLIRQGSVFCRKVRLHDPQFRPEPADGELEIFYPELPVTEFTLDPELVVFEDEHILAVDKPAGVNTAPSPFSDRDCLTWGVEKYLGGQWPVHAVHRLDRDTGGLVLFAKHKAAEKGLHRLFRSREILKAYQAWTDPFPLDRSHPGFPVWRWRDQLDFRGKVQTAATTAVFRGQTVEHLFAWIVLPHTGRTHQIRRHFARYLVPLVGDRAYGRKDDRRPLGLRCALLRFVHPVTGVGLEIGLP